MNGPSSERSACLLLLPVLSKKSDSPSKVTQRLDISKRPFLRERSPRISRADVSEFTSYSAGSITPAINGHFSTIPKSKIKTSCTRGRKPCAHPPISTRCRVLNTRCLGVCVCQTETEQFDGSVGSVKQSLSSSVRKQVEEQQ